MFEANHGGAPYNVLAMLAKLGHKTAFMGKVGYIFLGGGHSLKPVSKKSELIHHFYAWMAKYILRWLRRDLGSNGEGGLYDRESRHFDFF